MKYVYIIEIGQLSRIDNIFHFYDMEVFPSKESAVANIKNMIECNTRGKFSELVSSGQVEVNENMTTFNRGEMSSTHYTYNCMSHAAPGEEAKEMRVRYVLKKMKVNRNY